MRVIFRVTKRKTILRLAVYLPKKSIFSRLFFNLSVIICEITANESKYER